MKNQSKYNSIEIDDLLGWLLALGIFFSCLLGFAILCFYAFKGGAL